MKELTRDQIKERAKFLRQVLLEKHKVDLPHGHALEVLSKVLGYGDWNTASALSAKLSNEKPATEKPAAKANEEKPIATKFETTDEAAEFFLKFPKGTKLIVNDYQWSEANANNPGFGVVTSECSLTYDYEIQNGNELRLELNTETERHDHTIGKSASQSFDKTPAGRSQRRIKYLHMVRQNEMLERVIKSGRKI
jgi:hypothetical protein